MSGAARGSESRPDPARGDHGARNDRGAGRDAVDVTELRQRIEAVDRRILDLVAERLSLARRIGAAKAGDAAATLDPGREAAVIRNAVEAGRERGLPEEPVRQLFWTLVGLCRATQMEER